MLSSFISLLVLTYCFSWYTNAIQKRKIILGSVMSGAVTCLNLIAAVQAVQNPWSISGAILGSIMGTGLSVWTMKTR